MDQNFPLEDRALEADREMEYNCFVVEDKEMNVGDWAMEGKEDLHPHPLDQEGLRGSQIQTFYNLIRISFGDFAVSKFLTLLLLSIIEIHKLIL